MRASQLKLWIYNIMRIALLFISLTTIIIISITLISMSSSVSDNNDNSMRSTSNTKMSLFVNANDDITTMNNHDNHDNIDVHNNNHNNQKIHIGFGTAALGDNVHNTIIIALQYGFRIFDTAEADWWYNQKAVGIALKEYFTTGEFHNQQQQKQHRQNEETMNCVNDDDDNNDKSCHANSHDIVVPSSTESSSICEKENLLISTKIGPWDLMSEEKIRSNAANSRQELLGFCDNDNNDNKYPLDIYYIHAPTCWNGWHSRCNGIKSTDLLSLRNIWLAMEKIISIDKNTKRIGLSNISPNELLDIILFVHERQKQNNNMISSDDSNSIPRIPDVVQAYSDPIHPNHELRIICIQNNIEFVSYSTLGTQHQMKNGVNPVLGNDVIIELATIYQRSTAEIVLSWAIQNNMSIIPRSTNQLHIQQLSNLLIYNNISSTSNNIGFLSINDLEKINSLSVE